jgi:magnesium-transporting ATPase (P-type)
MTVVEAYVGENLFTRQPRQSEISAPIHKLLIEGVVLNSDRRVDEAKMNFDVPAEDWKWEGDGGATEAALLSWISRYYETPDTNIMRQRVINGERIVQFFPFSSAKKFSAVVIGDAVPDAEDPSKTTIPPTARMYFKGAADRIISRCTRYVDSEGVSHPVPYANGSLALDERPAPGVAGMCQWKRGQETCNKWAVLGTKGGQAVCCGDPSHRPAGVAADQLSLIEKHPYKLMDNMTRSGLRCIAFAYVDDVPLALKDGQLEDPDVTKGSEWTLTGLVGIRDPLRVETRDAVMTVQQAGIVVRMVTGDNLDTAVFIAKDCGIISHPRQVAIEGVDFRRALEENEAYRAKNGEDNADFLTLVTNLRVMARCQPEDKLELVKFLKEHDQIVGVTGDGSNDGPALKTANVGLAMGIAGTDVSKAAADIIILDDNFSSIVRSVMWGRSVFDNIRKFLQFQLSVNVCALVVALIGAVGTGDEPLKPIQLLWVNLVMDTMGALSIGTEIPKPSLLQRRPYRPGSNLISRIMYRNIIGQAVCQLLILLPMLFTGQDWFPETLHHWVLNKDTGVMEYVVWDLKLYTWIFNTFVWLQLFNEINARKVNTEMNCFAGIFDNAWFGSLFAISGFLQVLIVEFFGVFMETEPQDWNLWLTALGFGASQLVSGFLLKFWTCDPEEGQIYLDPETFENAAWKEDPSLLGVMFKYQAKDLRAEDDGAAALSSKQNVYIGDMYTQIA